MSKNQWALGLFDCCCYKDSDGSCWIIPTFFPQALLSPCCIDGEIHTIMHQEKPICCRMSSAGLCKCLVEIPVSFLGPFNGLFLSICCGILTRRNVVRMYNIDDSKACTCCGLCSANFIHGNFHLIN